MTKTALVTGASRGIGREVAQTLGREGWLVIAAVRDATTAPAATQAEIVDMADAKSIEALARRLRERQQRLDALVNNAGVYTGPARQIWKVNVLGPLLLTRALGPPLLAHGARVVMVTSGLGRAAAQSARLVKRLSDPGLSLEDLERLAAEAPGDYGASKAALNAMARLFAARLADRGNPGERRQPRLGPDGHGRPECAAVGRRGRSERVVGCYTARRRTDRWRVRRRKADHVTRLSRARDGYVHRPTGECGWPGCCWLWPMPLRTHSP